MKWTRKRDPNDHPIPDVILLFLEGELAEKESETVAAHLKDCWNCRAYSEQLEAGVISFVAYRNEMFLPDLAPPPQGWRDFARRMKEAMSTASGSSGSYRRVLRHVFAPVLQVASRAKLLSIPRMAMATVILLAVLFWFFFGHDTALSAAEILQWSTRAAQIPAITMTNPVVHQHLLITSGGYSESWEVWCALEKKRQRKIEQLGSASADLRGVYNHNGLDFEQPLASSNFSRWRDGLARREDKVTQSEDKRAVEVTTVNRGTAGVNEIEQASLTLRISDWHPIKESLQVVSVSGGFREYTLAEVSYEVMSLASVPAGIFPEEITAHPSGIAPARLAVPIAPAGPSAAELADVEVAARYALHRIGADLGSSINFTIDTQNKPSGVLVQGLVDSADRKQELLQALSEIPFVKAELQTEEEAVSHQQPVSAGTLITAETKSVSMRSPIEKELLEHFGSPEEVDAFSKRVLAVSESLMDHAGALHNLSERYPEQMPGTIHLNASSLQLLETMESDDRNTIKEQALELADLLKPILLSIADTTPQISPAGMPFFDRAQHIEQLTLHLLFGSELAEASVNGPHTQEADALLRELAKLQSELNSKE